MLKRASTQQSLLQLVYLVCLSRSRLLQGLLTMRVF